MSLMSCLRICFIPRLADSEGWQKEEACVSLGLCQLLVRLCRPGSPTVSSLLSLCIVNDEDRSVCVLARTLGICKNVRTSTSIYSSKCSHWYIQPMTIRQQFFLSTYLVFLKVRSLSLFCLSPCSLDNLLDSRWLFTASWQHDCLYLVVCWRMRSH